MSADDRSPLPCCTGCGTRVGVYERLWWERRDGGVEVSSLLNLPPGEREHRIAVWHLECLPAERLLEAPD